MLSLGSPHVKFNRKNSDCQRNADTCMNYFYGLMKKFFLQVNEKEIIFIKKLKNF